MTDETHVQQEESATVDRADRADRADRVDPVPAAANE